jgi:hypothetical protein
MGIEPPIIQTAAHRYTAELSQLFSGWILYIQRRENLVSRI